ncbi:MAG TPA: sulfatase-like hydrolase/transferase [Bryobacteraceae bacterium]|nr:sulfatase-like hydrolase/transferase [Bryobacteraceae bacterium]
MNVVVVTLDTLRADRLGCYGYKQVETPVLDRLAREGALFENAVAQSPLTPPSHASIFTGTYPAVHKVRNTGGFVLPSSSRTLAAVLQERGWGTAAFIGASVLKKAFGLNLGFAVYDDKMPKAQSRDEVGEYPERRAGVVVDRAIEWLGAQSGKPFFIWVHLYDPHFPYDPPEPFRSSYASNPYDGEVAYTDRELGRLVAAVDRKAAKNTIFVVLADHGESLGEHGEYSHGVFLYDATLHIPLIIKGAGIPAGVRVKQQVRTIDVMPTIMDLLGGQPPSASQGVSAVPAFTGGALRTSFSFAETLYPKMNMGWADLTGVRTSRWKYIRAPKPELYDLAQDPHETRNVINEYRKDADELEAELRRYARTDRPEKVEIHGADDKTMQQLQSLGYVSGFAGREFQMDGRGADPKDRTGSLKAIEMAAGPSSAKRRPAEKIAVLERALAGDAMNPTLYYHLGSEYERAGRHPAALKLYQTAIRKGVENGRLHSRIADLQLRAGNKDAAIIEYERASKFDPLDADAHTNLATAYLEKGRVADAERVFKWVLAAGQEHAAAYNGLGLVAIQRQDPATARGYFEKAVQLDPDLVEAQLNLGLIYRMSGDVPRARQCFETFLKKASPTQYGSILPKVREELAAMR